ncbi:MAG TPA: ATP-binding protein [Polyangiaceae bacterium]|nr:ATP-binding protein [Polyangiaceae bacterium]
MPGPMRKGGLGAKAASFALLSLLMAVPLLWLGRQHSAQVASNDLREHERALTIVARSIAQQFDQMLETRCRDLEMLASGIEVLGGPESAGARELLLRHRARSGEHTGTSLRDRDGHALPRVTEPNPQGELTPSASDADLAHSRAQPRHDKTTISLVEEGDGLHTHNVLIAAPIFGPAHQLVGYSEGLLSLDVFARRVRAAAAEIPGSRIVVLDDRARVVTDSSAPDGLSGADLSAIPLFRDFRGGASLRTALDEHGGELRAALQPAGSLLPGWRVVAAEADRAIAAQSRSARKQAWVAALMAWLVLVASSGAIALWFGRRISALADTVNAIGSGDFSCRASPARTWEPQEIRVLVHELATMADGLSQHTEQLESMVQERTHALALINERLLTLVDALERAGDGIEITDPQAKFIYVNPAWERLTGYSRADVSGMSPSILRSGTEPEAFYEAIWQRIISGDVYTGAFLGKRKDGTLFDQELTVWPVRSREGEIVHIVGLRRDVTEKARTEQALRISERMASVGTLAAGIAHEINNPLTYVLISLRFAQAELQQKATQGPTHVIEALERAIEGAERVSSIVRELRVFSRPNDRALSVIDPRVVLDSALRMVDNDIRHRAHLVRDFQEVPAVLGNDARLSQVFLNLLVNAVQALESCDRERSAITVRTSTDEKGFAVIEISDTGVGIDPQHLSKIFDPFFTTKPVGLGTGIGLSVCHGIVKSMDGIIAVDSKLGHGSVFRVRLPGASEGAHTTSVSLARHSV